MQVCIINQQRLLLGRVGLVQTPFRRRLSTHTLHTHFFCATFLKLFSLIRLEDDRLATQKALQTVVAGRQAENLLCAIRYSVLHSVTDSSSPFSLSDFGDDDDIATSDGQPSGLAATQVLSQTPAAANLLAGTSSNPLDDLVSIFGGSGGNGGGFGLAPASTTPVATATSTNLDPLAGLSPSGGGATTAAKQQQGQQEDLLGLF